MATPEPTSSRSRVIGMLGGMSWESSAEYYRLVNEVVRERLGGLHSARCVLSSVDFAVIEELQVAGRWEEAGNLLAVEAAKLESAGAEVLVLCTNTMHRFCRTYSDGHSRRPDPGRHRHSAAAHRRRHRAGRQRRRVEHDRAAGYGLHH